MSLGVIDNDLSSQVTLGDSMRTLLCIALMGMASCDSLWTGFKEPWPGYNNSIDFADAGAPSDLLYFPLPCPPAKGLSGDNLFCVDFTTVNSLNDLTGWNFAAGAAPQAWVLAKSTQTAKNALLISDFAIYKGDSAFTTPQIDITNPKYSAYTRLTLSIQQRVDINSQVVRINNTNYGPQFAQIFLDDNTFLISQATGQTHPHQLTFNIDKANLPAMPTGGYQFYVNFHAPYTAGGANTGWEIDSIAINGSRD